MSVSHRFSFARPASRWEPVIIGAAFAAVAVAGQTRLGAWLRGFLSVPRERQRQDPIRRRIEAGWSLARLRDALVGRRKPLLFALYGPPRTAALGPIMITGADAAGPALWRADVWYYVVDQPAHTAMAIRFRGGVAREVDFFDAPQPTS